VANFVLVHGAGGGSVSWRLLEPLLSQRGHRVLAPSLTGLGDRFHLGGPHVNLSTHIQDVTAIIEHLDLDNVVLVGHSYGGVVVMGAADCVPEHIAHTVFLDALLPEDGQAVMDMEGADELKSMQVEDGWLLVFPEPPPGAPRQPSRGQPLGTLQEKLRLSLPLEQRPFTRTYVKAGGNPPTPPDKRTGNFWNAADRVRFDPAWRYFELPANHGIHREMPALVAAILLNLAEGNQT
jgi:pimeloyl-ACP methyl ester carboxylesterase